MSVIKGHRGGNHLPRACFSTAESGTRKKHDACDDGENGSAGQFPMIGEEIPNEVLVLTDHLREGFRMSTRNTSHAAIIAAERT